MADCAKANGVFLMEAMWTRFFPAMYDLRRLLFKGKGDRRNSPRDGKYVL